MQKPQSINQGSSKRKLLDVLPEGLLVDSKWLINHGFTRNDIDYYLRSGVLSAVQRGLYGRAGVPVKWEALVQSLTEAGYAAHVGGEQALVEQGFGHFVTMSRTQVVHLYSADKLPRWLEYWRTEQGNDGFRLELHRQPWLSGLSEQMFTQRSYGLRDWKIRVAQIELAALECLFDCETEADFQQVDRWFESLHSLSPNRLQNLLANCPSVKTKRLFGWFSERHQHAWAKHLDWAKVDLGKGKRSVIKGGSFDKHWQITVPRSMETKDGSEQSVF